MANERLRQIRERVRLGERWERARPRHLTSGLARGMAIVALAVACALGGVSLLTTSSSGSLLAFVAAIAAVAIAIMALVWADAPGRDR